MFKTSDCPKRHEFDPIDFMDHVVRCVHFKLSTFKILVIPCERTFLSISKRTDLQYNDHFSFNGIPIFPEIIFKRLEEGKNKLASSL